MTPVADIAATSDFGLGIDAGGTQTRWALANTAGDSVAEGSVAGLSGLQMATESGTRHVRETIAELAAKVMVHARPTRVFAGFTGLGTHGERLCTLIAGALGLQVDAVTLVTDIEIACRDLYAPGEGYVVYAGTGSVAAFVDANGTLHRAGGRGALIDDAGGGFWIAREAIKQIWREEDVQPGTWRDSPLAQEIFRRVGGSDWAHMRQFVYGSGSETSRGEIGKLALAVAAVGDADPVAARILAEAGEELARLARALISRFGSRPVTLSGRVVELHPMIAESMRAALPETTHLRIKTSEAHVAAARIAAKSIVNASL
ncbi:MAG: BadF/BadG/BcrA/BcrD ATPase family protein [Betaproteobacteria bacterium]